MLGGDGEAFLKRERQALVGVDELAGHIRLAVDVAGAGMRFDDQVERPFGRLEAVLRQEAGDIARRHRRESGHAIDAGSGDQRFGRYQLPRGDQQDIGSQIALLQRADQRPGERAERGGADVRHIRVPQRHETVQLPLRFC